MADDARINVVGPDGWTGSIPVGGLKDALAQGYQVESGDSIHDRQLEQKYGDSPITSGLEGAARGATFGLSDLALPALGVTSDEALRERKERNPTAAGIGEAAGYVAPALLTGGGGLLAGAGEAAGSAAAKGLAGRFGEGLLARAAEKAGAAAVRTGTEGAVMGLGEGISDVALSKDPMSAEAIIGSLAGHAALGLGLGAVAGAGTSALGSAIGYAGGKVATAAGDALDKMASESGAKSLTPEVRQALADPALQAADAPGLKVMREAEQTQVDAVRDGQAKQLAQDISSYREAYRDFGMRLNAQLPAGEGLGRAVNATERRLESVVGNLESDPGKALDALQRQQQALQDVVAPRLPSDTLTTTLKANQDLQDRIGLLTQDATSPKLEAIDARLEQLKNPLGAGLIQKGVGAAIGGAVGHLSGIPGAGWLGALFGKSIAEDASGYITRKLSGAFAEKAAALADGAKNLFTKIAPPASASAALEDLSTAVGGTATGSTFARAAGAISSAAANLDQTRSQVHDQLAGLRAQAPQTADQVETGLLAKIQFLASKVPKIPEAIGQALAGPARWDPSDAAKATFARYVAAANDPLRVVAELRAQSVSRETVEVMQALYPQMLSRLQQNIAAELGKPEVAARVPYAMRLQLSKVMGSPMDSSLQPGFVSRIQSIFSRPPAPPPKPPSSAPATQPDTMGQRFAGG